MWTDYFLKFPTYEHYYQTMPEEWQTEASETHATDVIGTLYRNDTFAPLEGFHVNLRLKQGISLPANLQPYNLPAPALPKRVFA